MPVRTHNTRVGECDAVVVENEFLLLTVLPELGAKIYDIVHKGTGRNVLWHNPRITPRKVPFGSRFDDVWSGGWDEIFPNDAESTVGSERFPDMGEAWALPWDCKVERGPERVTLTTTVMTPITPARITRKLTLRSGESRFTCRYEIRNLSRNEIKFLWKVHPAFEINGSCRIEIPAGRGIVDPRYSRFFSQARYAWPSVLSSDGKKVDVSRVEPDSNTCTLHYVTDLGEGVARFVDAKSRLVSSLSFDRKVMDNVWLFLAYGGWRGHNTAVIEPSTSYPYDLAAAIKKGRCTSLPGGGRLTASVGFRVDALASRTGKRTKAASNLPER